MQDQRQAEVEWGQNGVPISTIFDDPYYSLENGLAETRHVFLDGNNLPERFTDGFHIAELGFGTGLNMLTALDSFRRSGTLGKLRFTSFEAFPMAAADIKAALKAFPQLDASLVIEFIRAGRLETDDLDAHLVIGDARGTIKTMVSPADAWFLDGFSPVKNPELWDGDLMRDVGANTAKGGSFATYTAAGHVRRALASAGFEVRRIPGFGRKRHMSVGTRI